MIKESSKDLIIKDRIDLREMITIHLHQKSIKEMIHRKNLDFKINVDITVHMEIKMKDFKIEVVNSKTIEMVVISETKKTNKDVIIAKKKVILLEIAQSLIEILIIEETEVVTWATDRQTILKQIVITIEIIIYIKLLNVEKLL
jgi:hypothetical protein